MTDGISLPKFSLGKRSAFFEDPASDHLLGMVLELATELAVVYSRNNRLERFLQAQGVIDLEELNAFQPDEAAEQEVKEWRELLLERLFHTLHQEAWTVARKGD